MVKPLNLPVQTTSFIGREREAADVKRLLFTTRLLTITGAGGCGKTRLSFAAAADLVDRFPDGVWWVDLAPIADGSLVVRTVAAAGSIREIPGQPILDTLLHGLRERQVLILLDNCEHVIGPCAETVQTVISSVPTVSVLATSREPLGIGGEVTFRIPSLSFPAEPIPKTVEGLSQYDAVHLFVDRALRSSPDFRVTNDSVPAVAEICHRLDGIPLAIELAAARTRVLTPDQIAAGLSDVLRMLTGGARTALPRQRTLEASIDWSHELLDDRERMLFRRLAAFAGGFTLEAVEAVCAFDGIDRSDILDLLTGLTDKSLVQADQGKEAVRFRLLETIRQYAERKLSDADESASVRQRHLEHFVTFGERAQRKLEGHGHVEWVEIVQTELGNVRAAVEWSLTQADGSTGLRLIGALWAFWIARSSSEGRMRLQAALDHPNVDRASRPPALVAGWDLSMTFGDPIAANACGDEALAISRELGETKMIGRSAMAAGWSKVFLDPESARPILEEGVSLSMSADDPLCSADCLAALGFLEISNGRPVAGRRYLEKAVESARSCGLPVLIVRTLLFLGWDLHLLTDLATASTVLREARELSEVMHERMWSNVCRIELAMITLLQGSVDDARAELAHVSAEAREIVSGYGIAISAWGAGQAEYAAGDLPAAAAAFAEGIPIQSLVGLHWLEIWSKASLAEIVVATGEKDAAREHLQQAEEVLKSYPGAIAAGRVHLARAALARSTDDLTAAEAATHDALRVFFEAQHDQGVVETLERLAVLMVDLERFTEVARLLAAADAARKQIGYVRFPVDTTPYAAAVERCRAELGDRAFAEASAEGAALSLEAAVSYAERGRGSRKRPSAGWASLTPAELDVVRLVAEGLTNAAIAKRLFLSPRTVQAHLARIFARLGVGSRTELAGEAIRRGLTIA